MRALAVVGNLSLDRVDGGEPRVGGAPFHAARALRVLGRPAIVAAKGADADRRVLLPPLVRLGLPVLWRGGDSTASFSFHYSGNLRSMVVDALGPEWTEADLRGLERVDWVHVGSLARSDFPAGTLAALARDRRLSFDGQGLVRPPRTGPLTLDAEYDPEVLRHVSVLKLAEEEARVLLGAEPDLEALALAWRPGDRGHLRLRGLDRLRRRPARACSRAARRRRDRPDRRGRRLHGRLPRLALVRLRAGPGCAPRNRARRRPARPEALVRALVRTVDGVFEVDLEEELVLGPSSDAVEPQEVPLSLPLVVAAAAVGSTVIAVVDRRPPLAVSNDAGRTWRESGGGLPPGRAIAIAEDDPDHVLYAARNRLYESRNGGVFWRALTPELPEIEAVSLRA